MNNQVSIKPDGWYLALRYCPHSMARLTPGIKPASETALPAIWLDGDNLCNDWEETLAGCWQALKEKGILVIWWPDIEKIDVRSGQPRLNASKVRQTVFSKFADLVILEDDLIDGHMFFVFQRGGQGKCWRKADHHTAVFRTGAFGDALMAATILPALSQKTDQIDFIVGLQGLEVLQNNPYINDLFGLYPKQVSDNELAYYWAALERRYDQFINLTYSVEGELLKMPSRGDYFLPDEQRRRLCAKSYLHYQQNAAAVFGEYQPTFFPTLDEKKWADDIKNKLGDFILIQLVGSSVHKWYPFMPEVVVQLLQRTNYQIVLSGDKSALEHEGACLDAALRWFGDTSRIHSLVDVTSMRTAMALTMQANIVIGGETGIMHAVSMQPNVGKICLLSHSSPVNLTDDWQATIAITPTTPCYPCHRLHYTHEHCPQDQKTNAAACAASITPDRIIYAVNEMGSFLQKNQDQPCDLRVAS